MLPVRRSTDTKANWDFNEDDRSKPEASNMAWITHWRETDSSFCSPNDVILLGGKSLADFRVRVAQSHARHDLTPSYWSLVGVIDGDRVLTAPLWPLLSPDLVPISNGVRSLPLTDFDDSGLWPNVAIIRFPPTQEPPIDCIGRLTQQRSVIDVPTLLLSWLGFVWGAGSTGNPLLTGFGVPSAVLVETAFGMGEVEITPGLATASSCPEAIYQAAKWWRDYYQLSAGNTGRRKRKVLDHPAGRYLLRNREASYIEPELPKEPPVSTSA